MSTINQRISQRAAQFALGTIPSFKHIKVDIDQSGQLVYIDVVTGKQNTDFEIIANNRSTIGLVDYRHFAPGTGRGALNNIGRSVGALQLESEVMVVNRFLRDAVTDPVKAERLRNLGLDRMIGQEVTGEFFKFNTQGKPSVIKAIEALGISNKAASASITDEGFSFLTLTGVNRSINAREASYLRILSGAEQISTDFLSSLVGTSQGGQNWASVAKLAKRLQSTMSPRNVMVGEEFIQQYMDVGGTFHERALGINSVAARLEIMFRDSTKGIPSIHPQSGKITYQDIPDFDLTDIEKEFILGGPGEGEITQGLSSAEKRFAKGTPERTNAIKNFLNRKLTTKRNRELEELKTVHNFSDSEIIRFRRLFDEVNAELRPILADPNHARYSEFTGMTYAEAQFQLMKEKVEELKNSTRRAHLGIMDRRLGARISDAFVGMEKARDGQFYIPETELDTMISAFTSERDRLANQIKSAGVPMTLDQTENLKALEKQIEHLQKAKQKIDSGDVIARVNIGIGQFKGEAMILSKKISQRYADQNGVLPSVIADVSAIKKEVGSVFARNFGMDIGDGDTRVFTDPLMMLYHGDYFTQPAMIGTIRENTLYGLSKTQEFMQNGVAPKEVMEALRRDLEGDLKIIDQVMLDPQTRMSHIRKKREAEEILAQMASGIRANEIPEMVRRVADHYSAGVMRYKDGRVDLVMPTAGRFSLRTFESRIDLAEDFNAIKSYDISMPGVGSVSTVGFRIKDKTLEIAGKAAYLYQHSLGGFDLDDKGIPLMSTFKDQSGKQRLAFLALRQPTSFQEYVAMSADLSDAKTVNAIFANQEKFKAALQDDNVLTALNIDKNSKTYKQLNEMVNGSGRGIKRSSVDQDDLEQLILQIINSDHVYPQGLPSLTNTQMIGMLTTQSASILGLDRLLGSGNQLSPLGLFMQNLGLDPNKMPAPYESESIFQVLHAASEKDLNTRLFQQASQELGYTIDTPDKVKMILGILSGKTTEQQVRSIIPGYKSEDSVRLTAILKDIGTEIMKDSANSEADDSIGLFINRQSASISTLQTSRSILEEEFGMTPLDPRYAEFKKISSIMTLTGSEAVDVQKEIGVERVLSNFAEQLDLMRIQGISQEQANAALEAYVRTLGSEFGPLGQLTPDQLDQLLIPMKLGGLGKSSLRGFSSVGYVRGLQISEQISKTGTIDEKTLYGLQEHLFETTQAGRDWRLRQNKRWRRRCKHKR